MTTRISLSVDPHVMSEEYIIAVGYRWWSTTYETKIY